jgi:hypothetical protein
VLEWALLGRRKPDLDSSKRRSAFRLTANNVVVISIVAVADYEPVASVPRR